MVDLILQTHKAGDLSISSDSALARNLAKVSG